MIGEFTLLSTLAVHHLMIGTVMILCLLIFNRFRQVSAEVKSWLWLTSFISATIIPMTMIAQSPEPVNQLKVTKQVVIKDSVTQSPSDATPIVELQGTEENVWHFPIEWVYFYGPVIYLFLAVWATGSLWCSLYLLRRLRHTRALKREAKSSPLHLSHPDLEDLQFFSSQRIHSPMVVGVIKPCILVPETMQQQLSEDVLIPVLLHEKAHIKRGDVAFSLLQEIIAIVFWWSPVIRIINQQIHVSRELACDMRAANATQGHKAYAQSLLECAKLMVRQKQNVVAMALFSKKKELNHRIESVLTSKKSRIPGMGYSLVICIGLSLVTVKAAQSFSPRISVDEVAREAKQYSLLSDYIGRALIEAVINQDINAIRGMVEQGVDINTPARRDGTALMIAVKRNDMAIVNGLLDLGADPNQSSLGDGNPLIIAAMRNNLDMARVLVERGANVNAAVERDETPLINATRNGYLEMTRFLVENGADVNLAMRTGYSDGFELRSPLNMARTDAIRDYLIQNGATPIE